MADQSDDTRQLRELVERAVGGDVEAFGGIYERYADSVYRFALFRLGDAHDAEDLTEQTFVRAFEAIGRYKIGGAPFAAWLFRIARNLVTDHFRRRSRRGEVDIDEMAEQLTDRRGTHDLAEGRIDARELHDAIAKLTVDQRTVVLMKFFGGLSNAETANVMGKNEGSVKSLQHRALASLGRHLKDHFDVLLEETTEEEAEER